MKKLIVSVGLATIGASVLNAQMIPGLTSAEKAKDWSIAASVRGFYDDNYLTLPNGLSRSSYGTEVTPAFWLSHNTGDTTYNVSYIYDLQWYVDHSTTDQSHQIDANLKHSFSDRYSISADENFIYSSEPTVLDPAILSSPLRTSGDNIHNIATLTGKAELTPLLDLEASYANNVYSYQQTFGDVYNPVGQPLTPSRAALLDRMEQLATLSLEWKIEPDLTGVLSYQYGHVGYTSPETILFLPTPVVSKSRNDDSHFVFVGLDKDFTGQLRGSIRAGGEYLDYYNQGATSTSPYVDASLSWQYLPSGTLMAGVKHQHNATDVVGAGTILAGQPVLDAESTAAYATLSQQFAGAWLVSALGQLQHSAFNGGSVSGQSENFFILNLNFSYRFNPYLLAEAGYNWNKLVSDISARDYTRDQVYIGVRYTY